MAAIEEHLYYPKTKIHSASNRATDDTSPASVRHAYFVGYLALACGAAALLLASREAMKTSAGRRTTCSDPGGDR